MNKKHFLNLPANTAVIYGRYSSDNQREESIDAQVRGAVNLPPIKAWTL